MEHLVEPIFFAIATVIVVYCVYKYFQLRNVLTKIDKIPGPDKVPILGNLLEILKCDTVQLFEKFREWRRKHGPVYQFTALGVVVVVVSGAEEYEEIVSGLKNLRKGVNYELVEPWLGQGLLTNTGHTWQQRRKILTPAFHFSILQQFVEIFNKETSKLVTVLKEESKKPSVNIVPLLSQTTLNTIAETSFGTTLDMKKQDDKNYVSAIHVLGQILVHRITRPWWHHNLLFNLLSPSAFKYRKTLNTLLGFTNRIIKQREENFNTFQVNDDNTLVKSKKLAFLDLLLNAKLTNGIVDDQAIKDEVNTFMFEGHDTTGTAICWILRQLTIYKEYQDLIYEEILSVVGKAGNHPNMNTLNELKLMERFIKETLRLFPSVPFISRKLDQDVVLHGYLVPKEANIDIWIYDIHRDPKHWPNPTKFDPDRFLPENCVDRHPFAFVPFSAGPRNCIGQRFAMLELKAMLCGIVQNFTIESVGTEVEEVKIQTDMVLRAAGPMNLKFKMRNI